MNRSNLFSVLLLASHFAAGQVVPTLPGPGNVYEAGSLCFLAWDPDTSGQWKNMTIDLMSGPNEAMEHIQTVVSNLDGTDGNVSPLNWTCPEVDPYSAIYFYQFLNPETMSKAWTTRFTIAPENGRVSSPEHPKQSNGEEIPWGSGHLKGPEDSDDADKAMDTDMDEAATAIRTPTSPSSSQTFSPSPTKILPSNETPADASPSSLAEVDTDSCVFLAIHYSTVFIPVLAVFFMSM